MEQILENFRKKCGIGEYPPEYNPKIHGPYYPNRYYGKADTKFADVKLGEILQWLSRRDFHPLNMIRCASRATWKWQMKWMMVSKPTLVPFIQIAMASSLFYFINQYPKYRTLGHHHTKYHW